jgi:putative ABC transport system permease protein
MNATALRATRAAFRLIIVRDVLTQRVRTVTTVAGIALGIAVLLAIQLASSAALRGFASSVDSLAGRAALEISEAPLGLDERRLPGLQWLQDYGQVTAIVEGDATWTSPDGTQQVLRVLGIDILTDLAFRDYAFTDRQRTEQSTRDLLSLLTDTDAVVLTQSFASARGLGVGSDVQFRIGDERRTFHVRALLADTGPARALGGNLIVMDIAAAQVALGRLGVIDRLELRVDDATQLDRIEAEISKRLDEISGSHAAALSETSVAKGASDANSARNPSAGATARSTSGTRAIDEAGASAAGAELTVQRPSRRGRQVEKMQAAFRSNLTALSTIALIAGMFLVYNTVSASVVHRRQEIGMLRAVGASRALVFALFLGEALVLAIPGCLLGLLLGRLLAQGAIALTAGTVARMYVPASASVPPMLDVWHISFAFLIGVPLALIAAAAPAGEAARIPPTDAIRSAPLVPPASRWVRAMVAIGSFALAAWLCTFDAIDNLPLAGYLATFFIIVGTTALTAPLLLLAASAAQFLFGLRRGGVPSSGSASSSGTGRSASSDGNGGDSVRGSARSGSGGSSGVDVRSGLFILEAWLASSTLVEYARRMAVSVAALAVSLAMTVAIAVMVSSFRETVIYWVDQTFVADLYVGPAARRAGSLTATVPAEVEALVRAQPGVAAVDGFRVMDVPFHDARIFVNAGNYDALLAHARLLFKSPSQARALDAVRESIGRDAAIVSEAFALRYRMHVGDAVALPTPAGPRAFPIIAIYYDYSSDRGTVMLDRPVFARHFGEHRPNGLNVYLAPNADADATRRALLIALGRDSSTSSSANGSSRSTGSSGTGSSGTNAVGTGMTVFTNRSLRAEVLRIFDGTFAITWALEVVAIIVAVMGIVATLVTAIDERKRELAMLRLVGASRGQVQRMVVVEAALLGAIGQALGLFAGFGLSFVLIYVINVQSFGWSIQFHPPIVFLLQLAIVLIVATAVAGVYPARRAARTFLTEQNGGER